ncbi:spore germination B3 GerAC family protein [Clostridium tetanomorphum DSM 665]|uniref:Ger(x)C family spore germination protein n=1 Tax=Clostridium tetanomorphum TaxID=1553 RepID=UPI0004469EA5|nr:Ger(x)C family spore germination protein [Clostridium tetanomorphum]KAJ53101.1 spore germination B3 GerAC family protein [Clostridium tetanomorphum DSM 665]MBP1863553.1 spore germination protein KC [Clostridium tetanomorphum]
MLYGTKKIKLFIICLMFFVLSGCWNNKELTEMGIVVGVGIEKVENDELEVTVQLIEPTSDEEGKQGSKKKTWRLLSARGSTAFEANRNLLTKVNKTLNYSNIQVMIIGEKLAEEGIDDILDFFQRVHEIDKREIVLISKGIKPKVLLGIEPEQADASSLEIIETVKNTDRLASIRKMTMYDLILNVVEEGNSVVGMVKVSEVNKKLTTSNLDFTGAAVFKKDKLVGWLNASETYGFLIVDNKFKNPIINVPNPINSDEKVTVEITKSVTKKNVSFNNSKPVLLVEVQAEGKMVEQHGKGDLTSADQIRALEEETSKEIKKVIDKTIKNAQQDLRIDIFGFDKIIHSKNLNYWREVKNNWNDIFCDSPVEIKVQYKNKEMGFIKKHI